MIDLLYKCANDLLDAVSDVLAGGGLDVPARRFVDVGPAATAPVNAEGNCEAQITCVVLGPRNAQPPLTTSPAPPTARGVAAVVWTVTFNVGVWRCHKPAGQALPKAAVLDAAAREWLMEGWQLARGLGYRWKTKTLLPTLGPEAAYDSIRLGDCAPVGPTGGVRGWVVPVSTIVYDQFDPTNLPG